VSHLPRRSHRAFLCGVAVAALMAITLTVPASDLAATTHTYNGPAPSFTGDLAAGKVVAVVIDESDRVLQVTDRGGQVYSVSYPDTVQLTGLLAKYPRVVVTSTGPNAQWWRQALIVLAPLVGIISLFAFVVSRRRPRRRAGSSG
jgi:ATP-dependent Zn protease